MKKVLFGILFISFSVVIGLPANAQSNSEKDKNLAKLRFQIDSLYNSKIAVDGPGAAILVSYEGRKLISKGYGLRDLKTKQPITSKTNLRLGSVSKQFTALAILSLIEDGHLSLKDTVNKILPTEIFTEVTIEQLMHHTSGIAQYEEHFFTQWDTTKIATNKDILNWYYQNPEANFSPGEKWEYSNGGYNLLATIVEKVSGENFADYAKEHVFEKFGMTDTKYFDLANPSNINERAFCYRKENEEWKKVDGHYLNGCLGEGAVYSNLNDYHIYDQALRRGELFSNHINKMILRPGPIEIPLEEQYRFSFNIGHPVKYAKGWVLDQNIAYHAGSWHGQRSIVVRGINKPFTIALFMNIGDSELWRELIDSTFSFVQHYLNLNQDSQ